MLFLLRNLRQKIRLGNNKLVAYLLYAIGEIILVVVGILIAVNIDDWNEANKLRSMEQKILRSLRKEFSYNKYLLDREIIKLDSIIENALLIAAATGPVVHTEEQEMARLFYNTFRSTLSYNPIPGTLNEMVNSGKLSIISNDSLRQMLVAWPIAVKSVNDQEGYVDEMYRKTHQYYFDFGNFRRHINLIDPTTDLGESKFPVNDFKFMERVQFENDLIFFISTIRVLKYELYPGLMSQLSTIDSLISTQTEE